MNQVLFWIPGLDWPVYGFGLMLFLVFVVSSWLAGRRAQREGLPKDKIADLVLWIFLGGIVGARITYMIQFRQQFQNPLVDFFKIWNGGIVFYGSAIGGWLTYMLAKKLLKLHVSTWMLVDILAPSIAMGLAIGRIGCFLNGCCWGHVAAPGTPLPAHFPTLTCPAAHAEPSSPGAIQNYQTFVGFTLDPAKPEECVVNLVEPGSAAATAGLRPGDVVIEAAGSPCKFPGDLGFLLGQGWRPGKQTLELKVLRGEKEEELTFTPRTIGLYPTQIYESITALLIFFVLVSLYPLRLFDGQVMVVLMLCYAVHRYLNEMLRHDTAPIAFGLTLSQNVSALFLVSGVILWVWRSRYPRADQAVGQSAQGKPAGHAEQVETNVEQPTRS